MPFQPCTQVSRKKRRRKNKRRFNSISIRDTFGQAPEGACTDAKYTTSHEFEPFLNNGGCFEFKDCNINDRNGVYLLGVVRSAIVIGMA